MSGERERREVVQIEQHVAYYSGPLPPPEMMRGYEEVQPGSADRILATMEREQKQRATYENRGLLFGFLAALALIALSAYVVSLGFAAASVGCDSSQHSKHGWHIRLQQPQPPPGTARKARSTPESIVTARIARQRKRPKLALPNLPQHHNPRPFTHPSTPIPRYPETTCALTTQ